MKNLDIKNTFGTKMYHMEEMRTSKPSKGGKSQNYWAPPWLKKLVLNMATESKKSSGCTLHTADTQCPCTSWTNNNQRVNEICKAPQLAGIGICIQSSSLKQAAAAQPSPGTWSLHKTVTQWHLPSPRVTAFTGWSNTVSHYFKHILKHSSSSTVCSGSSLSVCASAA